MVITETDDKLMAAAAIIGESKRPGTGDFIGRDLYKVIGKTAKRDLPKDVQVKKQDVE